MTLRRGRARHEFANQQAVGTTLTIVAIRDLGYGNGSVTAA
jgi:hypothetical protein